MFQYYIHRNTKDVKFIHKLNSYKFKIDLGKYNL